MEIEMLQDERLRVWCGRLEMPPGATDALVKVAQQINSDPDLHQIFTTFYEKTSLKGEWHREWSDLPVDPLVTERLGSSASLFYLLGYMAALPLTEREYRRLGISLDVFHDTMLDFSIWVNHAYDLSGTWSFNQFSWIWRHVDCQLFRLGRLQFMLADFPGGITAFRHRGTGRILLLGDPTTLLRFDGYAEGAGGKPSGEDTWRAVFEESPAGWRGNRITPAGYTLREQSFLVRSEWELALKHGDTVLDLHIPRGEKLTTEECRASFQAAYRFFPTIFPDRPFKGIFCHTWFFTPQLQKILPLESNIVQFQREFYLYPHAGGPGFLWSFVFGEKYPTAETAPRDTHLRQVVLDWMAQGGELFDLPGVMLHNPDLWGTQPYYESPAARPAADNTPAAEPKPIMPAYQAYDSFDEDEDDEDIDDLEDYIDASEDDLDQDDSATEDDETAEE